MISIEYQTQNNDYLETSRLLDALCIFHKNLWTKHYPILQVRKYKSKDIQNKQNKSPHKKSADVGPGR